MSCNESQAVATDLHWTFVIETTEQLFEITCSPSDLANELRRIVDEDEELITIVEIDPTTVLGDGWKQYVS